MGEIDLRPVERNDCRILWEWRNDPVTRKYAFNTECIPYETHKKWFENSLKNKNRHIFIVLKEDERVGEIRFDINPQTKAADVDITIDPRYRGMCIGREALKKACSYAFKNLKIKKFIAKIKTSNKASLKIFEYVGFDIEKENDTIIMVLK